MGRKKRIQNRIIDPMGLSSWNMDGRKTEKVKTSGLDPAQYDYKNLHWSTKLKIMLKNSGKIKRFLTGKNKAGRIFHSLIDVLPVPNVHEVIKRVLKEADHSGKALSAWQVTRQTLQRLDKSRTVVAIIIAILLIQGSEWTGIDLDVLINLLQQISELL